MESKEYWFEYINKQYNEINQVINTYNSLGVDDLIHNAKNYIENTFEFNGYKYINTDVNFSKSKIDVIYKNEKNKNNITLIQAIYEPASRNVYLYNNSDVILNNDDKNNLKDILLKVFDIYYKLNN